MRRYRVRGLIIGFAIIALGLASLATGFLGTWESVATIGVGAYFAALMFMELRSSAKNPREAEAKYVHLPALHLVFLALGVIVFIGVLVVLFVARG